MFPAAIEDEKTTRTHRINQGKAKVKNIESPEDGAGGGIYSAPAGGKGRKIVKTVPRPTSLSTWRVPPCFSTMP